MLLGTHPTAQRTAHYLAYSGKKAWLHAVLCHCRLPAPPPVESPSVLQPVPPSFGRWNRSPQGSHRKGTEGKIWIHGLKNKWCVGEGRWGWGCVESVYFVSNHLCCGCEVWLLFRFDAYVCVCRCVCVCVCMCMHVYACVSACERERERVSEWVAVGFMLLSRNCMCASFFLQGFVKIARWSEMNYWALKESTEKTHRTVHKHARAFQVGGSKTSFSFVWCEQSPHFFTPQLCSLLCSWKKGSTALPSVICQ